MADEGDESQGEHQGRTAGLGASLQIELEQVIDCLHAQRRTWRVLSETLSSRSIPGQSCSRIISLTRTVGRTDCPEDEAVGVDSYMAHARGSIM